MITDDSKSRSDVYSQLESQRQVDQLVSSVTSTSSAVPQLVVTGFVSTFYMPSRNAYKTVDGEMVKTVMQAEPYEDEIMVIHRIYD